MQARAKTLKNGEPYREVGEMLSKSIETTVNKGGRPKWKKRKKDYSHPILDLTGRMRDDAESTALQWTRKGQYMVNQVKGPAYGYYHQYGKGHLPVRKYVKPLRPEVNAMMKVFRTAFLDPK